MLARDGPHAVGHVIEQHLRRVGGPDAYDAQVARVRLHVGVRVGGDGAGLEVRRWRGAGETLTWVDSPRRRSRPREQAG